MYKSTQNKCLYFAMHSFPKTAKNVSNVYKTGVWYRKADDMHSLFIVLYRFRLIIGLKRKIRATYC